MLNVTIPKVSTRETSGLSKITGKPWSMTFQDIYVHIVDQDGQTLPFPERSEVILDKDRQSGQPIVFPVGKYILHPSSIQVGQRGLEVAPKLIPVKA